MISGVFFCITSPFQVARFVSTKPSNRSRYKVALVVLASLNALLLYIGSVYVLLMITGLTKGVTDMLIVSLFVVPLIMISCAGIYFDSK